MPSASRSYLDERPLRDRLGGATGAAILTALLLLMLFTMAPPFQSKEPARSGLSSFGLLPEAAPKPTPSRARTRQQRTVKAEKARARTKPERAAAPQVDTSAWPSDMIVMNREDFAASDIAKLPTHERPQENADAGAAGGGKGSARGAGTGPGGEQLYDADWYKRPTSAELGFYMPKTHPPEGWGLIACRTVERYRVEDCKILGESPEGSGFGRAVLNAAWQFKVLPPRIGGKPLVGAWVSIRIDYYESGSAIVGRSN